MGMTVDGGISHIKLSGFRSIKSAELDFNNLNVFIGANGSGKSNFMSFFQMLEFYLSSDDGLSQYVGRYGGANSLMYYGTQTTKSIAAGLTFLTTSGENTYNVELGEQTGGRLYFKDETVCFNPKDSAGNLEKRSPISLGAGIASSRLTQVFNDTESYEQFQITTIRTIRNIMRRWRFYQFHNTALDSYIRGASSIKDSGYLRSDAGNLAAFLHDMRDKHPDAFKSVVYTMKQITPYMETIKLNPDFNPEYVRIQWSEKANSRYDIDATLMSDGTLRALALVTLLSYPQKPPLICIDEPELGLHPEAIKIVGDLIKVASDDTQIFISTQSERLIDCFEPEDIVVVSKDSDNDGSRFDRLDYEKYKEWFEDYSISETWDTNIFGGRP